MAVLFVSKDFQQLVFEVLSVVLLNITIILSGTKLQS
jgi:hypothetical protein